MPACRGQISARSLAVPMPDSAQTGVNVLTEGVCGGVQKKFLDHVEDEDTGDDEVETVLKGVVRAEKLQHPEDFAEAILGRVKKEYIQKQYQVPQWADTTDFLSKLATQKGKLHKGGEPDLKNVSVTLINDWQRVCSGSNSLLLSSLFHYISTYTF